MFQHIIWCDLLNLLQGLTAVNTTGAFLSDHHLLCPHMHVSDNPHAFKGNLHIISTNAAPGGRDAALTVVLFAVGVLRTVAHPLSAARWAQV